MSKIARKAPERKRRRGNEHLPEDIQAPTVCRRWPERIEIRLAGTQSAPDAIGSLSSGAVICGVNRGQFSAADLLGAILEQTGPAVVDVATWTMTEDKALMIRRMIDDGRITSFRLILDRSFGTREPEYCAAVVGLIGNERIRTTRTHCKIITVRNAAWNVIVLTSANMGSDPRLEHFVLFEDAELTAWWTAIHDELFARPASTNWDSDRDLPYLDAPPVAVHDVGQGVRLTKAEVARRFNITPQAVGRLCKVGTLVFDEVGTIGVEEVERQYAARRRRIDRPDDVDPDAKAEAENYYVARARNERLQADTREMRLAIMRSEYVDVEAASRLWYELTAQTRERALGQRAAFASAALEIIREDGQSDDNRLLSRLGALYDTSIRTTLHGLEEPPDVTHG